MRARKHTKANDEWRNGAIIEISGDSIEDVEQNSQKVLDYLREHGICPDELTSSKLICGDLIFDDLDDLTDAKKVLAQGSKQRLDR